jgi:hypothetical protein
MSLGDIFEDAWDFIVDGAEYFISFEWIGDVWEGMTEFLGSAFSLEGFSFLGLTFGVLAFAFSYLTKYLNFTTDGKGMTLIATMVQHMPPAQRVFWTIASYGAAFIAGYFLGNYFENT